MSKPGHKLMSRYSWARDLHGFWCRALVLSPAAVQRPFSLDDYQSRFRSKRITCKVGKAALLRAVPTSRDLWRARFALNLSKSARHTIFQW